MNNGAERQTNSSTVSFLNASADKFTKNNQFIPNFLNSDIQQQQHQSN